MRFTLALAVAASASTMLAAPPTAASAPSADKRALAVEGAGPEYEEACRAFLAANASDATNGPTYAEAVPLLRKAADKAKDSQTKLRCLYLAAFSQLLAGDAKAADATAADALTLMPEAHPGHPAAARLAKLLRAADEAPPLGVAALSRLLGLSPETEGLLDDLHRLATAQARHRRRAEARWHKHAGIMARRITEWTEQEGLSDPDVADLRARMEARFRPRGYVDLTELENALVKASLDILTR